MGGHRSDASSVHSGDSAPYLAVSGLNASTSWHHGVTETLGRKMEKLVPRYAKGAMDAA